MPLLAVTSQNVTLLVAFGGGVISFLSPCVLPIVPGYLSLITGVSAGEISRGTTTTRLRHVAWNTLLFIAGFTVVFVGLGLISTSLGTTLLNQQELLTRLAGALMIAMACYLAGSQILMKPALYQELRFRPHLDRFGLFAAPVAGAAFGFGWTPCIGPVLGSVLAVAATQDEVWRGGWLLFAYAMGLGVPFLALGLLMGRLSGTVDWFKRHGAAITYVSAGVLGVFGVLLLLDRLPWLTQQLTSLLDAVGLDGLVTIG